MDERAYLQLRRRGLRDGEIAGLLEASRVCPQPLPVAGTDVLLYKGIAVDRRELGPPDEGVFGMAGFATYDDLIAEITAGKRLVLPWQYNATTAPVAANWYHLWPVGGKPGPGVYTGGSNYDFQRTSDVTLGSIYHGGNKSPDTKHLISAWGLTSAGSPPPVLMLVDQVGFYRTAAPLPTAQTAFTNTTAPNRYVAAGESGLLISVVNTIVGGTTTWNLTRVEYVDQDGNAGALIPTTPTITGVVSAAAPSATLGARVCTTVAGAFLPLAAGDTGVRQLTNFQSSGAQQASMAFVLVKPLCYLPLPAANVPAERDLVMQLANLERVYDGACLTWCAYFPAATGAILNGALDVAWG